MAPDSPGQEQVDQRDMGLVAASGFQRLGPSARPDTLDPRLAAEQHPETPVHDVVIIDHEYAQAAQGTPTWLSGNHQPRAPATVGTLPELDHPALLHAS